MNSPRPVLFWDFDGTLVRSDSLWSRSMQKVLISHGHSTPLEVIRGHMRTGFTWHTPGQAYTASVGEGWWVRMYRHFDRLYRRLGIARQEWAALNARMREIVLSPESYTLYPDALNTLARCREMGFCNYILSNNYPELEEVTAALGFSPLLDGVIVSAQVGYEKPRNELFAHAVRRAGNPFFRAMIGDNPQADIRGAKAAGMVAVLVHGNSPCEADQVVERLAELPPFLAQYRLK